AERRAKIADQEEHDAERDMGGEKQMVHYDHDLIFGHVGSIFLQDFLVPALAEVGHEPEHVAPPLTVAGRMRIAFLVAMSVVFAMMAAPGEGRTFAGKTAEKRKQPADGSIGLEAAMGQAAMIAHANADRAGEQNQGGANDEAVPAEIER